MKLPRFTSRTRARKRALDILFEADQRGYGYNQQRILALLEKRKTVRAAQSELPEYSQQIVKGVCEHLREIDDLIAQYSTSWPIERMPGVDLCLARIAIWEILYVPEVADPVAAEQAANIAAVVSTDKSAGFLSGLLNQIIAIKPTLGIDDTTSQARELSPDGLSDEYDDDLDDIWLADLPQDLEEELSSDQ